MKISVEKGENGITFTDDKRSAFVENEKIEDLKEEAGELIIKLKKIDDYVPVSAILDAAEVDQFFRGVPKAPPGGID